MQSVESVVMLDMVFLLPNSNLEHSQPDVQLCHSVTSANIVERGGS